VIQTITENSNTTGHKGHFFIFDNRDSSQQLRLGITSGSSGIPIIDSRSPNSVITDTDWHHVAVTGNGANVVFYVDGIAYPGTGTMGTKGFGDSTNLLSIGDDTAGSPDVMEAFGGLIDEVEIFNRALSALEIQAIFNVDSVGKCKDADGDGVNDTDDNCPTTPNPDQADFDLDGEGDACDTETGPPKFKDQCKNGGWMRFDFPRAFENQGECIEFVKLTNSSHLESEFR
jgi:hypothetical protein